MTFTRELFGVLLEMASPSSPVQDGSCTVLPTKGPVLLICTSVACAGCCLNESRSWNQFQKCFVYKQDLPQAVLGKM